MDGVSVLLGISSEVDGIIDEDVDWDTEEVSPVVVSGAAKKLSTYAKFDACHSMIVLAEFL